MTKADFKLRSRRGNEAEGLQFSRNSACQRTEPKAAEDSRTPQPRGSSGAQSVATASWSAAVLCRFHFSHPRALPVPWPHAALSRSCNSPHVGGYAQNQISKPLLFHFETQT